MLSTGDGFEGRDPPETATLKAKLGIDRNEVFLMPGESEEQAIAAVRAEVEKTGDLDRVLAERKCLAQEAYVAALKEEK